MLDEKLEMPSSLAPPLTASWPAGVTKSLTAPGSTASDEGCSPRCSPRCSPTSSPSPSPTSEEEAWRWPEKQDKADSRERCCSSDSAIALPEQDNDSEDDGAQAWPVHGVCSRKCSVDDAADDVDDDIPAGSDASCQGDKRPAAAKAVADDGAFDDTWRSTNNLNQLCLAGLKGLSLDDVRWSRFTEHQGAGVDEDAEVEALVADGCDERGRRVKVFSFDSYDSGVSVSALRRASTQSTGALEDDSHPPYRYWRTPSVVVSDYSDDLSSFAGNAVTLDEIEQFRSQYAARVAAGMETGDLSSTDVSRASSCSNLQQLDADYALRCTGSRKSSYCSTCSTLSGDEDGVVCDSQLEAVRPKTKPSGWRKIRNIVTWSPFVQNYKNQQYFWVQLAGHQGNFRAGPTPGTILKKVCTAEEVAFKSLMKDRLKPYVPDYKGQITSEEGDSYLHLQDLLSEFNKPCVMDCKMGVRTYLEDELNKARGNQKLRKDMYEKMIAVNPDEPTEDERRAGGVTKTRYMVFRETMSSTATLGFRIEGLKKSDGQSSKDFKTTKDRDQIINAFREFTRGFPHTVSRYIQRLRAIKATLEVSDFFASHEVIGSSLLFVHDADKANIWLIDFAKSRVLPAGVGPITHNAPWIEGNHEDGYLIGLRNLIDIFTEMEQNPEEPPTPPQSNPSSPESSSPSAPSSTPASADSSPANTSPPTSPEEDATSPVVLRLPPRVSRAVPSLNRKDTVVAQVNDVDAQVDSPPPYSVQLELRPHPLASEAASTAEEDCAASASPREQQPRLSLPLPIHIKKTDTVLTLQTPAEAAALDRTELT